MATATMIGLIKEGIEMKKNKVVLSEELYDKYQNRYWEQVNENKKLQMENGYFKALFDKEEDTKVIKYDDKLYIIASTTYYKEVNNEESLEITAVPVGEVN